MKIFQVKHFFSSNLKILFLSIAIGLFACAISIFAFSSPGLNQPPNGNPTFWLPNGTSMYYSGGNVGIGTSTPFYGNSNGPNLIVKGVTTSDAGHWTGLIQASGPTNSVVMGELNGISTIGGVNANNTTWTNLAVNPGGGNVGVGTSTPNRKFVVDGAGFLINGNDTSGFEYEDWPFSSIAIRRSDNFTNNGITMTSFGYRNDPVYITDNSVANIRIWTESGVGSLATSNSNTILRMNSPGPLSLGSGGVADRFYMTSFGNVGIGTTNPALHGTTALTVSANTTWSPLEVDNGLSYTGATNCSDGCRLIELYGAGSWMGEVSVRGGTAYYSNGSDRRLKDNIEAVDPVEALNRLMNLPVRSFNFKAFPDGQRMEGFLADEAQSIVPYAVGGYKNQVDAQGKPIYQTLDYSKLTPLLTAGIQGLNNKIDPFYNGISIDSTVNTSAPFMKINDVGNIGIGTMNPMAKLDINGTSTIIEIPYTPITSGSACVKGTQSWDENYLYICTASNTWKRAALSNF